MKRLSHSPKQQTGFTIIELLIATLIFSVVLMLCTFGILQITRTYYKGVTSAKTQQASRAIIDRISQAIQFSGGGVRATQATTPNPGVSAFFCVGDQQYSYVLGRQLADGATPDHVLVINSPCTTGQNLSAVSASSEELMAPKMRLVNLTVTPVAGGDNLYKILVRVIYGDDDLLCSPTIKNDCGNTGTNDYSATTPSDLTCKSQIAGTQFCAVSELNTVVQKRLR